MNRLLNAADFRDQARQRLPRGLFEYIDRGTEDESALKRIRRSLDEITLTPRILVEKPPSKFSTTVMGRELKSPLIIAPTALAGIVAFDGETKLARAAAKLDIPFCISTQSVTSVEEVRSGAPNANLWFQLYMWKDRALSRQLLDRVWSCGVTTLVVTADTPTAPKREYNIRNGFSVPFRYSHRAALDMAMHPRWLVAVMLRYLLTTGVPSYGHYPKEFRSSLTRAKVADAVKLENLLNWGDIRQLRTWWKGEIIIKGVLSVEDARMTKAAGADGIVVSAHGGRNLDIGPAPATVLPDISDAVGSCLDVLADSGIERGSDVLKYISLGAKAVMLGRLPLWGLATDGEAGAAALLNVINTEIETTMQMLGGNLIQRE